MKKLILIIILFSLLSFPVSASEVSGKLTGIVISAEKQMTINHIQTEINRIMAMIVQLTRELNQLLKAK